MWNSNYLIRIRFILPFVRTTHEQLFFCIDIGTLNVYPNWLAFWIIYSTSAVTKLVKSDMRSSWRVPARNNVPSFRPLRILQNELGYCFWHSARQQGALLELYMLNVLAMPLIFDRSQGVILILLHKGLYYPGGEEVNKTTAMLWSKRLMLLLLFFSIIIMIVIIIIPAAHLLLLFCSIIIMIVIIIIIPDAHLLLLTVTLTIIVLFGP